MDIYNELLTNIFPDEHINIENFSILTATNYVLNYNNKYIIKVFSKEYNFKNEIEIYKLLQNETFIPKLLYVDHQKQLIITNFCGFGLNLNQLNNSIKCQVENILKVLKHYNVKHNDLSKVSKNCFRNLLIKDNIIYIIDFEYVSLNNQKPIKENCYIDENILLYFYKKIGR